MSKDFSQAEFRLNVDTSNYPFLADVQYREPLATPALNRKNRGILEQGIYNGFEVTPGTGLSVKVSSGSGESGALINVDGGYQIKVSQQKDFIVKLNKGNTYLILLEAFYDGKTITNQVEASAAQKAAQVIAVPKNQPVKSNQIILAEVVVAGNATKIVPANISTAKRNQVYVGGILRLIKGALGFSEVIGTWLRSAPGKGFLPSKNNDGVLGDSKNYFSSSHVTQYQGGYLNLSSGTESKIGGSFAVVRPNGQSGALSVRDAANKNGVSLNFVAGGTNSARLSAKSGGKDQTIFDFNYQTFQVSFKKKPIITVKPDANAAKLAGDSATTTGNFPLWYRGNDDVYTTLNKVYVTNVTYGGLVTKVNKAAADIIANKKTADTGIAQAKAAAKAADTKAQGAVNKADANKGQIDAIKTDRAKPIPAKRVPPANNNATKGTGFGGFRYQLKVENGENVLRLYTD